MKKSARIRGTIFLVFILILVVVSGCADTKEPEPATETAPFDIGDALAGGNLIAFHANIQPGDSAKCMVCHGDMMREESLDPNIPSAHPLMLSLSHWKLVCTDCHGSVDLLEKSGAHLRKQVNVQKCITCHANEFYFGLSY